MSSRDAGTHRRGRMRVRFSTAFAVVFFLVCSVCSSAAGESLSRIPKVSRAARHPSRPSARKVGRARSTDSSSFSYHPPRPPAIYHPVRVTYRGSSKGGNAAALAAATPVRRLPGAPGARPGAPPGAPVDAKVASLETPIEHFSRLNAIDPDLTRAVIAAESGGDHLSVSPKGAKGLMQLMPQTASMLGVRNAFNPVENIYGGTRYLRSLYDRFGRVDLALWAYNAGPGAVEKGRMPDETRAYIGRVYDYFRRFRSQ